MPLVGPISKAPRGSWPANEDVGAEGLRRLPIHGLKLSPLFTEGVPNNRSDVAVCQAVSAIARSLGLGLVAEGVESEAQRQFLLNLGVPVGQGFLFAPGLLPDEFARRLADAPLERVLHA